MTSRELSKEIKADLYPDVVAAGTLSNALAKAFADQGSQLKPESLIASLAFTRTEGDSRFCQMYIAAEERLFLFDFWSKGVGCGRGSTSSLSDAAQAIHFWIVEQPNLAQMQARFSFFIPDEQAIAHEAGRVVEYQWGKLLETWRVRANPELDAISPLPLIEAAMKQPELAQLFPFTSMHTLHFSRTTGYPFTIDCPFAEPIGNNRFRAYKGRKDVGDRGEVIGEGTAEEVVAMLVAHLPPNCGPAVDGTAKDLKEEQP